MSDVKYSEYIAGPDWAAFRLRYWAGGHKRQCAACRGASRIDLHHRTYERLGREQFADVVPLCRFCHDAVHNAARQKKRPLDAETDRFIARAMRRRAATVSLGDAVPQVIRKGRRTRQVAKPKRRVVTVSKAKERLRSENDQLRELQASLRTRSASAAA